MDNHIDYMPAWEATLMWLKSANMGGTRREMAETTLDGYFDMIERKRQLMHPETPASELPSQRSEQPQPRYRNVYDYDGEYEFSVARHWIMPEATPFPGKTRLL
jgi:hypothetical protein